MLRRTGGSLYERGRLSERRPLGLRGIVDQAAAFFFLR